MIQHLLHQYHLVARKQIVTSYQWWHIKLSLAQYCLDEPRKVSVGPMQGTLLPQHGLCSGLRFREFISSIHIPPHIYLTLIASVNIDNRIQLIARAVFFKTEIKSSDSWRTVNQFSNASNEFVMHRGRSSPTISPVLESDKGTVTFK